MKTSPIERDERTESIEHASYGLAYKVLAFGVLLDVMYRSWRFNEATWDLLGLVIVSGLVLSAYQARHSILGRRWARMTAIVAGVAFVTAIVLVTVLSRQ